MRNGSATRNSGKAKTIQTQAELARFVDRNPGQITRWLKHPEWPVKRKPPWTPTDHPEILRFVAERHGSEERQKIGKLADGEISELRKRKLQEEIRKLTAQATGAETENRRIEGTLIEADKVEQEWAAIGSAVRTAFQSLPSQLVPLALTHGMPNESAAQYKQQIDEAVAAVLRRLSKDGDEIDSGIADEVLSEPVPEGTMDAERVGGAVPGSVGG